VDIDISLDYGLTLLAALLIGTGFVLQQSAAVIEPDSRFLSLRLILDLFHKPRWLLGIGCMVIGQILAAWSIGKLPLAFVEPLLTTSLVFALVVAVPIAKASLRVWEITGALVLCTGVALLSVSRSAKPIGLSFGSFSHWPAAGAIALIAFVCVQAGRRRPGRARAMLTGVAAGLVFGIQDALTRQTLQALHDSGFAGMASIWAPYALIGAGATGIYLMQSAFNSGPLNASLPSISAGEPVVGILLGIVVFGDRIQDTPGELAIYASGLAALVAGVIMVGRAPALSQLRAWTEGNIPSLPHVPVPHVPVPHIPVPHVPSLPRGLPGRRADRDHDDEKGDPVPDGTGFDGTAFDDAGFDGTASDDAASTPNGSAQREVPLAPSGVVITPPEPGAAPQTIRPDIRWLRLRPQRPAKADLTRQHERAVPRRAALGVTATRPQTGGLAMDFCRRGRADDAQPRGAASLLPLATNRSRAVPIPPSSEISFLIVTIMVGIAQKSPQTQRMAAPICWSAKGGRVTPGTWS
jgi:drug/metabolite transporter (DMT)-like permease